jgi:hypothetical protein
MHDLDVTMLLQNFANHCGDRSRMVPDALQWVLPKHFQAMDRPL